jgi:hypothetical protein
MIKISPLVTEHLRQGPMAVAADPRDDLLKSIRDGKALKKVDMVERPLLVPTPQTDVLANALNNALKNRRCAIDPESDSESESMPYFADEWSDD